VAKNGGSDVGLTEEQFAAICEEFLLAMPGPEDNPLDVPGFAERRFAAKPVGLRRAALAACKALVATFSRLGLIDNSHPALIKPVSDDAGTLLRSLGQHMSAHLVLLGDWRARGRTADAQRHRALIGMLEEYRIGRQGDKAPASRRIKSVAAIIKGKIGGQQVYLVQYNSAWEIPWWIGGIIEKTDADPEEALRREIEEELGLPPTAIDSMRFFNEMRYPRFSARMRAMTDYHTSFYFVVLKDGKSTSEHFYKSYESETTDKYGRVLRRHNYWLSWEQLRGFPGFEAVAGNIADFLEQHGVKDLNAPHSVRPEGTALSDSTTDLWDALSPLDQQTWLATRVQEFLPVVEEICTLAQKDLYTLTDDDSFDAYESKSQERVHAQVNAIYAALRRRGIHYRIEPWTIDRRRQRVRLPLEVFKSEADGGCCIDLACAMASCLLARGIRPLLVVLEGHALLGYWLEETILLHSDSRPQTVLDGSSAEAELMRMGFVETTCLTLPGKFPFHRAQELAHDNLKNHKSRFVVDINACREAGFWGAGYVRLAK
jgi:8-oxo-dGTP pyrophosphatase MutT (NUDIX family)